MTLKEDAGAFMDTLRHLVGSVIRNALPGVAEAEKTARAGMRAVTLSLLLGKGGDQVYIPKSLDTPFIQSLRDWIRAALLEAMQNHNVPEAEEKAGEGAREILVAIREEWSEERFNVPLRDQEIDAAIYDEIVSGTPAANLTAKYRIAKSTVYAKYHAEHARRAAPRQGMLPGV